MKWICKHEALFREIQNSLEFVQPKAGFSIYSNIYLSVSANQLEIKTTNSNQGYESVIDIQGSEDGKITVQGDKFVELIKSLKDEETLSFETDDEFLYITSVMSSVLLKLRYVSAESFNYNSVEAQYSLSIPYDLFVDAVSKTLMSVLEDETKKKNQNMSLGGINVEFYNNSIVFVSTDTRCLTYYNKDFSCPDEVCDKKVIIPAKFARDIIKIVPTGEVFEMHFSENIVQIKFKNTSMWTVLSKGSFPVYNKLIEAEYKHEVIFNTADLERMLRHVIVMSDEKSKMILFKFMQNKLYLSSVGGEDLGSGEEELGCDFDEDEEVRFVVYYTYIQNHLKSINSKEVTISFNEPKAPIRIQPHPTKDYSVILMTMSI